MFSGFTDAYGTYEITGVKEETGKTEGRALTYREPVTQDLWTGHLNGVKGLGIIALTIDDTCHWAALDIDINDIDHKLLEDQINNLKLPLKVFRSKSGGAHVFVFLQEPMPAKKLISKMNSFSSALGHGGCEVFPKQFQRVDENDLGNFLNMPYFKAELTTRYLIHEGEDREFEEMLDICEAAKITEEELDSIIIEELEHVSSMFDGAPPCLRMLFNLGGFPDGTRNQGMFNVGIYLRKRFPEEWEDKLMEYNIKLCDPSLPKAELDILIKSLNKKDSYEYRCSEAPIKAYCNRSSCMTCPFGIGNSGGTFLQIDNLRMLEGDPVLWYVNIGEHRLVMTSEDLLNQSKFKQKVMETVRRVPTTMKTHKWTEMLDQKIQNCDVQVSPKEASSDGEFHHLLSQYLTGHTQAKTKEELKDRGAPFFDEGDGFIYFRGAGLWRYLDTNAFRYKSKNHIWQVLKDTFECEEMVLRTENGLVRCWKMRAIKLEDEELKDEQD